MTDKDLLHRFLFDKALIRGEFVHLDESFKAILTQHDYPKPIQQLLGEALCAAALLSAIIKFSGRLTVQFRGKGKLKLLLAQCDNQFNIRGLAKWDGELSYDDLMEAFNHGVLVIMLDSGLKSRYQGVVSWKGNSLAESIEGYFRESEQLATKIWLTVKDTSAAGFLLQIVPASPEHVHEGIEHHALHPNWERVTKLTASLQSEQMLNEDYQTLLSNLYPEEEIRIFDSVPVRFHCTCSRKRGEDAIMILGQKEAEAELKNNKTIVVTCDFCNKEYIFDAADVAKMFAGQGDPPTDIHLH